MDYPQVTPILLLNQVTKTCANKACEQINPLPETKQYFYYNVVKQRYDSFCKKCRNKQKQIQRGHRRKGYTWVKAFLRGLRNDKYYDPRMTEDVIEVIMRLQEFKCALTNVSFLLPTKHDLLINKRYKGWLRSLSIKDQLRTPRLIATVYGESLIPGNCLFICNYLYTLYQQHGSIVDVLTFHKLKPPVIYQANRIYKELNLNED